MFGYIAFYKGKRHEVRTDKGIYTAQLLAADFFKVARKKSYLVHVVLAERPDGTQVVHTVTA
jgi:hypothetical protein